MISWDNPIEKFTIDLYKSWMPISSCIHVTGGAQGVRLLTWLINLMLNTFLLWSSTIEDILKICFDGYQFCSSETVMCLHVSILSSVEYREINPQVNPTIEIEVWVLKSASLLSGLCWFVGLSHIGIPKSWHWLGFIKNFFILFLNHNPWSIIDIMTPPWFHFIWGHACMYWDLYMFRILR